MELRRAAAIMISLSVSSFFGATAIARENAKDLERKVDRVFASYDRPDSPGCALGVVRNGEFIYKRGYGLGSLELSVPLTPQSVFYMASVSKQFTAASVVLAAEQGYLSLDDDVRQYIPELPSYGHPITLRQMLHHISGYRDVLDLIQLAGRNREDIHSTAELLDLVSRQRALNYTPGEEYLYSNTNYWLMSIVIQRATGKPLSQFAAENIFRPLGMTHTHFYDDRLSVVPGRVPAYKQLAGGGFGIDWSTNFDKIGDGGLLSSVEDLLEWDRNFYANKLGKGSLLRELQTQGVLNDGKRIRYALGLEIATYRGLPIVEHSGAMFGYRTELLRFPQQKFSVICLCNVSNSDPRSLANQVAEIYLGGLLSPVHAPTVVHADTQLFAGHYRNLQSHATLEISAEHGGLVADEQRFEPVGATEFVTDSGDKLSFTLKSGSPAAVAFATSEDEAPLQFDKFQPLKPSETDLAQYVGAYTSRELQATYRFALKGDQLILAVNWQEPTVLAPTVQDEFRGPDDMFVVFHRDSGGRVSGLDIFEDRIKQISFEKAAVPAEGNATQIVH